MKKFLLFISAILFLLNFSACSTKTEDEVISSGTKDVSELLKTLIQKEKEINELNKQLEECRETKKIK